MPNPVLVEVTRGPLVESTHRGAVAIADARGELRFALGDVETPVYPRSAFKMMQALPLVESGAADAFKVSPKELSMACASHSGEPFHVRAAGKWLARIGCQECDLACGPHLPIGEEAAHAMLRARKTPTRLHNNCSGKHTGFLTLARHLGAPVEDYVGLEHPVQRAVRQTVGELCDSEPSSMPVGIDGCAAPNFALPLSKLALGFARLADPTGLGKTRSKAAKRLMSAVTRHPLFESGTGRADAIFIAAAGGGTMTKVGAEAVYGAAIPSLGLGVALKIDDGAGRGAETAIAAILGRLGVLDPQSAVAASFIAAPVRNWRGEQCGVRRPSAALSAISPAPGS
jgi:L-asparaginase II